MRGISLYLGGGALALLPLLYVSGDATHVAVWSLVVVAVALGAGVAGLRINRPPDRRAWYGVAVPGVAVAIGCVAVIVTARIGWRPDVPSIAYVLPCVASAAIAVSLFLFVRRCTAARDWAAVTDAGIVTLGITSILWMTVVEPALRDASLDLPSKLGLLATLVSLMAMLGLTIRLLLGPAVSWTERWFIGGAGAALVLAACAAPLGATRGWEMAAALSLAGLAVAQLLWGAAALDPTMWWLTQPGDATEPWPTRRRIGLLAGSTLAVLALLAYEVLLAEASIRGVLLLACIVLVALLAARLVGLAVGHERLAARELALESCSAALAVTKTRDEIRRVGVQTAAELAGGAGKAYIDVYFGTRPKLDIPEAAVLGTGVIADGLRGEIRLHGSLARIGIARTIVAPIVMRKQLAGIVRVTGTRPLSWDMQQSLDALAGKIVLALEALEVSNDLAERRSEARFRSLVQKSHDLIVVLEPDQTIRFVTPSVRTLLGCEPEELVGTKLDERLHSDERDQVVTLLRESMAAESLGTHDFRLRRADGVWRTFEGAMSDLLDDPAVRGLVLTARDVSDRRALEDELTRQAFHDSLTGLANRVLLSERVTHALDRAQRSGSDVAVLFLDLDDFKTINDSLGHEAGDELLVELAARLAQCMRSGDTAARLGGDEFGIVLEDTEGLEGAVAFAQRVLDAIAKPVMISGTKVHPRASIGITFGHHGQTSVELLRNADVAMYQAKRTGGSRSEVYDPGMHEAALVRLALKADLERALSDDELHIVYQPIVDLGTGMTKGLEALLRWTHPVRGPIAPSEFIPLAEESGMISELGQWILAHACRQTREWQRSIAGYDDLHVNVNLSARQILEPGLKSRIVSALELSGLRPEALTLEITESTMMEDVVAVSERLGELRGMGIRIAIDDFGTGFASLGYLRRFPVDDLKIAKEFIDDMVFDARNDRLIEGIVGLGAVLGLRTLAEGIESEEQQQRLRAMGCVLGQGYLFAHPVMSDQVPGLLKRGSTLAA